MREHLFRGKRVDNGEWAEGNYAHINDEHMISSNYRNHNELNNPHLEWVDIVPETVGEFTGLTDKNGKKIFEGDICQVFVKESNEKRIFEVCYGTFCDPNFDNGDLFLGFFIKGKLDDKTLNFTILQEQVIENCEIIGNIHDNKELLEDEE